MMRCLIAFLMLSIQFQGHMCLKIADFDPNLVFPDYNSSFNSLMAMEWCHSSIDQVTVLFKVIPHISRSHVTQKGTIVKLIERFRTVAPVWINWWLRNEAQRFT